MGLEIIESTNPVSIPLVIIGVIYLYIRLYCMRAFILSKKTAKSLWIEGEYDERFNGWFSPVVQHASYYVSIFMALAMIFSFRIKVLNMVSVVLYPSILITLPFKDGKVVFHPEDHGTTKGSLFWWNYITIHLPMVFLGIYMFITRQYTLSIWSYWLVVAIIIAFFLFLDDKDNGVLTGKDYMKSAAILLVIWTIITHVFIFRDLPSGVDPFIGPLIRWVWV